MKKFRWTHAVVAIFIIILIFAANSARSDDGARIAVGHTAFNSTTEMAELGYEWNNWEASVAIIGEDETKRGEQDTSYLYSISYLTRPDWCLGENFCNYYRLGVAKNDGNNLIGPEVYRLGIGMQYKDIVSLEYTHWSSAGIHSPNSGVDGIILRFHTPALF